MLAMITTKCNMSCQHCCMSCGKNYKGEHMSMEVYERVLEMSEQFGSWVVLSGGEPTLHPNFMEMLFMAVKSYQDSHCDIMPWLATNGSKRDTALWLAHHSGEYVDHSEVLEAADEYGIALNYSEEGYFSVSLSYDYWHDKHMVNQDVLEVFKQMKRNRTGEGIRDVSNKEVAAGHYSGIGSDNCCCPDLQVKTNGDVFVCGCNHAPRIGNIMDADIEDKITFVGENFDGCIDQPHSGEEYYDYETDEDVIQALKQRIGEIYTVRQWADDNIKIRKTKVDHPETYRISLEDQKTHPAYKEL